MSEQARDRLAALPDAETVRWLRECDLAIIGTVFPDRASAIEYERTSRCEQPHRLVALVPAEHLAAGDAAVAALARVKALLADHERMATHGNYTGAFFRGDLRRAIDGAGDGGERHG